MAAAFPLQALTNAEAFLSANLAAGMDAGSAEFQDAANSHRQIIETQLQSLPGGLSVADATAMLQAIASGSFPLGIREALMRGINTAVTSNNLTNPRLAPARQMMQTCLTLQNYFTQKEWDVLQSNQQALEDQPNGRFVNMWVGVSAIGLLRLWELICH